MTAVTYPLRPPRLAFAICWRRWQNDMYENKVYCVCVCGFNNVQPLKSNIKPTVTFYAFFSYANGPLRTSQRTRLYVARTIFTAKKSPVFW